MRHCLSLLLLSLCCSLASWGQSASAHVQQALQDMGCPVYSGNTVTLLTSAQEKYADMFQAIRQARRFVHLEYFILRKDSVGTELLNLLSDKVRDGVEVRVLIDAYGNYKSPLPLDENDMKAIRERGIRIDIFDPLRFPWIPNMLHRDHRKIVVVDGMIAYTGGMNVADYYLHGTKRTGPWRDMQVRLEGPVVDEFESIFARIWERTTGEHLDSLHYHAEPRAGGCKVVTVVNREPKLSNRHIRQAYVESLNAAQHEVRIVNPYPTNTHSVRRAMKHALKRGVRVRLMVSASGDNKIVPEVVGIQMKKMMRHGAEIYYYEGGFHHSKLMMVDGEFCTVGTANLDGRSMRYDYEVNAFIFSAETTRRLNDIFDGDMQQSQLLTPVTFKQRFSLKQRFVGRMMQPLKGLL